MKTFVIRCGLRGLVSVMVVTAVLTFGCWVDNNYCISDGAICCVVIPVIWGGFVLYELAAKLADRLGDKIKRKELEERATLIRSVVEDMKMMK